MTRLHTINDQLLPHLTDVQRIALNAQATLLDDRFPVLLQRLSELGNLTEVTHNGSALLEKHHVSGSLYSQNELTLAPTEAIQLRICYAQWKYGYALEELDDAGHTAHHSFQFFDHHGSMIHKIMLNKGKDTESFQQLLRDHAACHQRMPEHDAIAGENAGIGLSKIDINALRADWAHVQNHEDFIERQKTFDRHRLRKLRMAGKAFAYQVANDSARVILQRMTEFGTAIMTQVGNAGIVQAYCGKIKNIRSKDARLKIMNHGFRMLLREDDIDSIWVAKKPTTDGIVTSLEIFNRQGLQIASFLSKKRNGEPEPREWRDSIMRLMPIFGA